MSINTGGNLNVAGVGNLVGLNVTGITTLNSDAIVVGNVTLSQFIAQSGHFSGCVTVAGEITYANAQYITTDELVFVFGNNQNTGPLLDGGGIQVGNTGLATWQYNYPTNSWESNIDVTPQANTTQNLGNVVNYWGNLFVQNAAIPGNLEVGRVNGDFYGNASGLENIPGGNITGTITANTAVTVTANAQPNITTLGTLSALTVSGNITAGNILGTIVGSIANAEYANTARTAITVTSSAQPNIQSVGTLSTVNVAGNATVGGIKTDNYYYANGTPVSFSGGGGGNTNYSNANVAAYLPTYTGNLTAGNILTNNYLYANGQPFVAGTNYSNANVAAYLPTYSGSLAGDGVAIASLTGANVTGIVPQAGQSNYANTANAVAGANVIGAVNAANTATYAGTANAVAGANVTGTVANATYATSSGSAVTVTGNVTALQVVGTIANATYATTAGSTTSFTGNIAAANITGTVAQATQSNYANTANAITGSNVVGAVDLATYATTANAVAGANVIGAVAAATTLTGSVYGNLILTAVANATYATTAGIATSAYGVAAANVSGTIAQATQANYANTANAVAGANVIGTVANATYADSSGSAITVTGNIAAAQVIGNVANATYAISAGGATTATTAATVTTAAQPNITSVGTLSVLTVTGNITGNYFVGNGSLLTGIAASGSASLAGNLVGNLVANTFFITGLTGITVTGNTQGGNLLTAGLVSATGNIQANNVSGTFGAYAYTEMVTGNTANTTAAKLRITTSGTANSYIQTGNGTAGTTGNIIFAAYNNATTKVIIDTTSGNMSASGNVIGGNVTTVGLISATGNLYGGNLVGPSANVSVVAGSYNYVFDNTGNATMANGVTKVTTLSATGNVYANTGVSFIAYGTATSGFGAVYTGPSGYTALPSTTIQVTSNANTYSQLNMQNLSNGTQSTTELCFTANNGTDTTFFLDLGIAGNNYSNASANNSLGTSLWPNDSYVYAQGSTGNVGNLVIGTTTANTAIKFISGGSAAGNIVMQLNAPTANTAVAITGNVSASGNIVSNAYISAGGAVYANASAAIAFVSGPGAASNVALLIQPPANVSIAANQAIRDLSVANTTMYFDAGMGAANTGHSFQFRGSNAFTNYLTVNSTGLNAAGPLKVNNNQAVNGPAFSAYSNGDQSVATDVLTKITFGAEEYDTNSNFASSRFTPTVAGYYQLSAAVRFSGPIGTGERMIVIYKNGTEYKRAFNMSGTEGGSNWYQMNITSTVYANGTGDYYEIYCQHGGGANRNAQAGASLTYFNGSMVRGA